MSSEFRILTLVGWKVSKVDGDDESRHPANLLLPDERYWFFRYWTNERLKVDVMGLHRHIAFEKSFLRFYLWTPFRALWKASHYDLIFCFHSQLGLPLALMMKILKVNTPLVIVDVEGFGRKNSFWQRWLVRQALSRVSLVFHLATVQREDYAKHYPEILNRTEFLPLGIDPTRFPRPESKMEDYILSIGYQGSDFRDWKTLIEAYNLLNTKTKLLIVGRSGFRKGEIGDSTLENVEFVKSCDLPTLNEYVLKSKFVILPLTDRRQALGQMTLLGAMALGKAVLASSVPGVIGYVTDGQSGLFYQSGDHHDLAEKANRLLNRPGEAEKLGRSARKAIETRFHQENMAARILEILKERHLMADFSDSAAPTSGRTHETILMEKECVV